MLLVIITLAQKVFFLLRLRNSSPLSSSWIASTKWSMTQKRLRTPDVTQTSGRIVSIHASYPEKFRFKYWRWDGLSMLDF